MNCPCHRQICVVWDWATAFSSITGAERLILTHATLSKLGVNVLLKLRAPALALCPVCSWDTFQRQRQSWTLEKIRQKPVWGARGKCRSHRSVTYGLLAGGRCASSGAQIHPTCVASPGRDGAVSPSGRHRRLSGGQRWLVAAPGVGDGRTTGQRGGNLAKFWAKKVNGSNGEAAIAEGALLVFGSLMEVLVHLVHFVISRSWRVLFLAKHSTAGMLSKRRFDFTVIRIPRTWQHPRKD